MRHIKLNEEAIKQLETLLGEIPMKWASPIMNILSKGIQQDTTETDSNKVHKNSN
jgi:hypothetical protein